MASRLGTGKWLTYFIVYVCPTVKEMFVPVISTSIENPAGIVLIFAELTHRVFGTCCVTAGLGIPLAGLKHKIVFPKLDPLTVIGMALCVDLGPKCQHLFCLV